MRARDCSTKVTKFANEADACRRAGGSGLSADCTGVNVRQSEGGPVDGRVIDRVAGSLKRGAADYPKDIGEHPSFAEGDLIDLGISFAGSGSVEPDATIARLSAGTSRNRPVGGATGGESGEDRRQALLRRVRAKEHSACGRG